MVSTKRNGKEKQKLYGRGIGKTVRQERKIRRKKEKRKKGDRKNASRKTVRGEKK